MDPAIIIFAIESAVKLGRKAYAVLVDETAERPLLLPTAELFGSVPENVATQFFLQPENRHLIQSGGPYENFTGAQQLEAYRTLLEINRRLDSPAEDLAEAQQIISGLHAFAQLKEGFGAKSPVQRLLGTVVEIGIDYFSTHPEAMGRDSAARRVIHSFIGGLTDTDFAEASLSEIGGDLLGAALITFAQNTAFLQDDKRVQVLLSGVALSLAKEIDAATSPGAKLSKKQFLHRISSSILRGGAAAFSENIDLFLPVTEASSNALRNIVQTTLTQTLAGIEGKEDLFTSHSLEVVFRSALAAVGENAELLVDNDFLSKLIASTTSALTNTQGRKLFSDQTVAVIVHNALEVFRDNVETLFDPNKPEQQLLATALSGMAASLASNLAGAGDVKSLLSARQVMQLAGVVFEAVAAHPEQLLGNNLDDPKRTAVAQIIGSVASALGDDPTRLTNGAGFIELVRLALETAVLNADQLLNLDSASPRTNLLFQAIQQVVQAIVNQGDPRKIVTREVFVEIVARVLPVVSANLGLLIKGEEPVLETVRVALVFASESLKDRINGANLPELIQGLLQEVLLGELNLAETTALHQSVDQILRTA